MKRNIYCGILGVVEFPYYVEEVQIDMDLQQYKIIHLPKEQWKNVSIPMRYTSSNIMM